MSGNADAAVIDRRDVWLEDAFRVVTQGRLTVPNALQQAVFPRLTTQDTGLLIPTAPCAGRLEAIAIPSLVAMQVDETAHRLFIIGPDGSPLDDYMYRLSSYVRALVESDGVPRTIWFEEPERAPIARKYLADGSLINGASDSPFNEEVDIVAMPFSHFRTVFFNAGGVHGVPEGIGFDNEIAAAMAPRGLFYFDEAFGATRTDQLEFVRMVEFLFAQDLDIAVGASSLPDALIDDLAFLELLSVPQAQNDPDRRIECRQTAAGAVFDAICEAVSDGRASAQRIICAIDDTGGERASELQRRLRTIGDVPALYRTASSRAERGKVYAQLKSAEAAGAPYVLVADGPALEVADFDCDLLITEPCASIALLRRAGRCNRRGRRSEGRIVVVGDLSIPPRGAGAEALRAMYEAALRPQPFDSAAWKSLPSPA